MKKELYILKALFLLGVSTNVLTAYAQTALNFSALPKLVRERNQHAKGAEKLSHAAEAIKPSFLQPFYPTLKAEIGAERYRREILPQRQDPYWNANAEINLFRGGKDYLNRENLALEAKATELMAHETYLEELNKAREAYIQLVYSEALKQVLSEAKNLNDKNLGSASRRRSSGIATDTDQIEFEIKAQAIEQDLETVNLEIDEAISSLSVLLGVDVQSKNAFSWPKQLDQITFDTKKIQGEKLSTLGYEIESIESQQKRNDSKIASRWWIPDVDVYAGYAQNTMRESDEFLRSDRNEAYAGVKLSLTLFDRGDSLRKQRQESLLSEVKSLRLEQSARETQGDLHVALKIIAKNERLVEGSTKSAKSARRYLNQTLSEYSRGVKNSPDVSAATDKYIEAETRHLDIQKQHLLALSSLFKMLGPQLPQNN